LHIHEDFAYRPGLFTDCLPAASVVSLDLGVMVFAYTAVRYIPNSKYILMAVLSRYKAMPVDTSSIRTEIVVGRFMCSDCKVCCGGTLSG